jgi:hypothetical protein
MKRVTRPMTAIAVGLTISAVTMLGASPALAYTVCTGDLCVVYPDSVQTPLGVLTVTVSADNVVTAQLDPATPNTEVVGTIGSSTIAPGCTVECTDQGYTRTWIDTAGGPISIDTFQIPPGPPARTALPNRAIISLHPPGPCRVATTGTTVVFTRLIPPGPPA